MVAVRVVEVYSPGRTLRPPNRDAQASRRESARVKNLHLRADNSAVSPNWSGYVVTGAAASVTDIKGSWIVPTIDCSVSANTSSSFWVGIDGYPSTNPTLEQVGTAALCVNGTPAYYAWYEFIPNENANQIISTVTPQPGDPISAEVSGSGGQFTVTLTDETASQPTFMISESVPDAPQTAAEWIAEAPGVNNQTQPLSNFGTVYYGSSLTGVPGRVS